MPTFATREARRLLGLTIFVAPCLVPIAQAQGDEAAKKPIKVYILAGQSNMLEMGNVSGGNRRHSGFFRSAKADSQKGVEVSVYEGAYDASKDYDELEAKTKKIVVYDGMGRDPYPKADGAVTYVARGFIEVKDSGVYEFSPGYANSTYNVTECDGREVYRREPGKDAQRKPIRMIGGKRYAIRTTFFTKAANGLFWVGRTDIPGTLETVVKQQNKFGYLLGKNGKWRVRNDVLFQDARLHGGWNWDPKDSNVMRLDEQKLVRACKPLAIGRGVWVGIPFGFLLGDHHDEQVLIIRCAIGNRGLAWDFRPPSSGKLPDIRDDLKKWEGAEYRMMIGGVRATLRQLARVVPGYDDQGYELAGFVWFQGHKDSGNKAWAAEYEQNLVHLINDVRAELKTPKLPVVIATVGFAGHEMSGNTKTVWQAQMALGDPAKHPEFAGTVKSVDTRDFWRSREQSPSGQGYHYNRNAETYMLIGEAIARAMIGLVNR